jgi:tetratricopeptide (TPR) repeat protein
MLRIIELDPDHFDALNYLGYSWAERDINMEEALTMIEKALKIKPDVPYIIDSLGWTYYKLGRYEEAMGQLLKAYESMKEDPTVLEHLGDVYLKLGDGVNARKYWNLALNHDPDNERVIKKLNDLDQ